MKDKKSLRESNIELLRIILMMMIIMHHLITRGGGLRNIIESEEFTLSHSPFILFLINSLAIVAVNTFIFISGYFGIKFRVKKLLTFLFQVFFFSIIFYLIFVITGFYDFSFKEFIKASFPVIFYRWWFVTCFIALYAISPLLNNGLNLLSKKELGIIILTLFYLGNILFIPSNGISGNGFSLPNFILIYILGFYMKKFVKDVKYPLFIFLGSVFLIFSMSYSLFYYGKPILAWSIFSYNNPLLIIGAVGLFYTFKKIKIISPIINKISIYVFGIYLFHEHYYIHPQITKVVDYLGFKSNNDAVFFISLFLLMLIIFFLGCIFDKVRIMISNVIFNKINIKY